ncbi:hypothetical protein [Hymenobacter ruricola]|uniref:Uncharacterized protein n=1 Tax=Hymenobacter ruricola TaxID=2791023 RepID=A0ABS0HY18_9BACT|nr:hypothetical protein [Hymenobacter ruricola]MBF9219594.1 hypothetical protein [Hymenobacter ruricola]
MSCRLVIVDKFYHVLRELDAPEQYTNRTFTFAVSDSPFQKGQRYRVYYVMYSGATLYYKGHGDIQITSPF